MDGEIIEIRENELERCRAFWDMPEKIYMTKKLTVEPKVDYM